MTRRYIEVSARHHDQTVPIPFWLLKKKKPSYSRPLFTHWMTVGDGEPVTLFNMTRIQFNWFLAATNVRVIFIE